MTTEKMRFATPQEAETAFYAAFEAADLDAMMAVWMNDDDIICIHPICHRLQGREAVAESWQQIFANGPSVKLITSEAQYTQEAVLAIHQVKENMTLLEDGHDQSPILATNIYQLTDQGWRMVVHHASPVAISPEILEPSPVIH